MKDITVNSVKRHKIKVEDRLIASIDFSSKQEIIKLCTQINNSISTLKIGFEVIYSCGLDIIKTIKSFGYNVMLDAKLHDIPNTVSQAISAITKLGISKITIHASGGKEMLKAARDMVYNASEKLKIIRPMLFAVTILTSLDDNDLNEMGLKDGFCKSVLNLASLAQQSGIEAIICSPNEVEYLRDNLGYGLCIATPGIRLLDDAAGDQKRISTPYAAIKNGADYIIVGRSITLSKKPSESVKNILADIEKAVN